MKQKNEERKRKKMYKVIDQLYDQKIHFFFIYECVHVFDTMTGLLSVVVNKNQEVDNLKILRYILFIARLKVEWYHDNAMNITHK